MSGSSGGRADKLGNRYEGLWVAYQLLRLLAEQVVSVQLEALGDDERGVDVWVTRLDGSRDAQQCKRKNRTAGKWSIGELGRQDVLKHLSAQLSRNPSAEFIFVSAHPAPELRELCDTARAAGGDAEAYFHSTLSVAAHAEHLHKFCQIVGVDEKDAADRQRAFNLLRRTSTHLFEDSQEGRGMVTVLARCLIAGNPATAVEVLANLAQDRLGEVLTVDHVRQHLRGRELPPAHIAGHPQVAEQVERLRAEFRDSLRPTLIHSALVPRPETGTVFTHATEGTDRRLVVLHGRGGSGKSCVLLQLTELLEKAGVPYLPLRLDRRPPLTGSFRYGTDGCGLPESPAVVLHSLYPGRRTVLIVDQLDAVRWTAAHASAPWEACREVIDDALGLPNVVVVVACRTFDLRDDQQISAWQANRRGHEVAVGDLPDETVAGVVKSGGGNYADLTVRQKTLLRIPLHLALWAEVVAVGGVAGGWGTQADLLRAFWRSRFEAAERMGVPPAEAREAVEALVLDMNRRGELSAPVRLLDRFPRAGKAMKSLYVVVETDRRLTFAHQTYFEYQLATHLLDQIATGTGTIASWVRGGDQSLLRRDQLRLALTLLRDEDHEAYVRTLRELVFAPVGEIRFHLRQLALRVLGESPNPTAAETDLVCELIEYPAWREHVRDQVLGRQSVWFESLDDRGELTRWLASTDQQLCEATLLLCRWWSGRCGGRVAALVTPYLNSPGDWPQWVAATLPFNPADDSNGLFRIRLQLTSRGIVRNRHLMAKDLAERHPERLIELLEVHLDRRHEELGEEAVNSPAGERGFPYQIERHEAEHLERVADSLASMFWDRLMPRVVRTCEATCITPDGRRATPFFRDRTWSPDHRLLLHEPNVELLRIVARAGSRLATDDPAAFGSGYDAWLNYLGLSVQYTVGLALAGAGETAADVAINWLVDNPHRLSLHDEQGRRWGIAQRIIRRHAPACSPGTYLRLEEAILGYRDADERASVEWQRHCVRLGRTLRANRCGLTEHALLSCLPTNRMSDSARSQIGVRQRKFNRPAEEVERDYSGRIRTIVGPLPVERAARISDRGWLQIISGAVRTEVYWHRNIDDDTVAKSSPETFARLLGERARWEPERFALLALAIPGDADPAYLSAILNEIANTSPPSNDCSDWLPASDETVTAVIEKVGYREDRQIGDGVCWLMRQRPQAISTPLSIEIVRRYATEHPHPEPGWRISTDDVGYKATAINCTRGTAVGAITQVLFARPSQHGAFIPTLRLATADPHPAVRVAAVGACLPLLNSDPHLAVELFLSACENQEEMLSAPGVWDFFGSAIGSHYASLERLLTRMTGSKIQAVSTTGAAWQTVAALHHQCPWAAAVGLLSGNSAQRKGAAMAAADNCDDSVLVSRCAELLTPLLDDPEDEVREVAGKFLYRHGILRTPEGRALSRQFAAGRGFARHASWLIWAIRRTPDSLIPLASVLESICRRVVTDLVEQIRPPEQRNGFELEQFVPLILRLYEQAEQVRNQQLRIACLDWWDQLLEARMGGTAQLLGDLEASAAGTI